jgi:ribosome-binding factor A
MDSVRQNKISRLLQKELANVFLVESRNILPGKMITVTVVRVTPDLSLAKVYLSIFPRTADEDLIGTVNEHAKMIRNNLGHNIRHQVRVIPELAFYLDDSMDYVEKIDRLLKK